MAAARYVWGAIVVTVTFFLLVSGCGVNWFPDSTGSFQNNSSGFNNNSSAFTNNSSAFTNNSTVFSNVSTATRQPVSDSTGTVTVMYAIAKDSSRTSTGVEFTLYFHVVNTGSTRATVKIRAAAVDKDGKGVCEGTWSCFVEANSQKVPAVPGLELTTAQWNRITRWKVLEVTKTGS